MVSHLNLILQGIAIGFMASVPLGPIGVICVQRTLSGSRNTGFVSGLGAATADTLFAMAAIFMLSLVTSIIDDYKMWFQAAGGILIMLLGFSIFYKRVTRANSARKTKASLISNYLSVLFLTLPNPAYIFTFIALFAAFGINSSDNTVSENMMIIAGVAVGASTWWFILTWLINLLRKRFTLRHIWWINKITGAIIIICGAVVILSLVINMSGALLELDPFGAKGSF